MKKLPIGVSNFHKLVSNDYLFCDKTAMIADFLEKGDEVTLITRPRRWGKTLNMSMLQHFFASEVDGVTTAGLFDDLAIGKLEGGKYIREHQGKYPVIMISFKDVNADDFQGAYNAVYELISTLYESYTYLFKSNKVNQIQLKKLYRIINNEANQQQLEKSLKLLSQCLYQHHGRKVYILIDEYDTPLNKAYGNKPYLGAMVAFMRNLFSDALKDNTILEKGVLTGILRVSKDSMLSGLNNLETYTILDEDYSARFGFSETEVSSLFKAKDLATSMEEVRNWYNGYKVGHLVMYNPWSIISCINRSGRLDVYWVNTGNNDLIKQLIFASNEDIKEAFEQLMQGAALMVSIDKHLAFDLLPRNETAFWSLLLFAGYLTLEKSSLSQNSDLYDCLVKIPNNEVRRLYNRFFEEWLVGKFPSQSRYHSFLTHLLVGNVNDFTRDLSAYLLDSASFFDTSSTKQGESFYHGFVLAMLASISDRYAIRSNRESGFGRYDLLLIPKKESAKALLLEFKQVRKEEELETASKLALDQIQAQAYHTELLQYPHVQEVIEVGIAFSGKSVVAAYATYDLVRKQSGYVILTDRYGQQ
ncbi:MAG: ATP-binding protein [Candidatus Cardinium sp.]|uniref:AAA family ATPase n=1 Tax=Cardinium endosymbiont of Dermatophagoides farinae TaxID=2597823 RepID=UPI001181D983|nr:AAA family ATPase [Cardinium endosymbiont of Dermatophagoides farinae]TSJ81441.1 AAA family ATPase [Cardinium endosymbiont of Dermatophagoides farinae]UWW96421.1 MAG: ATP-binding protein [Candidatus Cardinium sp.]